MVFIIAGLYIALCIWLSKHDHPDDQPEEQTAPPPEPDYWELSRRIEQLHKTDERLRTVEQLITDLEICSPDEYTKAVTIEWTNAAGKTCRYNVWSDGRTNTEYLLMVANAERERLQSSLLLQLDGMKTGERRNANVTQTVIEIPSRGGADNA